jgi:putative spermidine/putrescine transport system ATP-binding protein
MQHASSLPIHVHQVAKKYGAVHALDHVDLDIASGEFLTLLGPSGSGKTTLLTVLAGFTRPDSGSLKFGGEEMITTPPHKRGVGMVFQNYALFPHMSVADNVAYPLKLRGMPRAEAARKVEQALGLVRLSGYGGRGIDQLSGGQRQRVALARAVVFEPRILLMDEPLSALDKQLREHMQIELRQLHDQLGMTTVYVTHDQREALTMSDRIAVIHHGRIMQLDTPRALYERPANRFVAEFIGESAFMPVQVRGGTARLGGQLLHCDCPEGLEGEAVLMLRPEHLRLAKPGDTGLNLFPAKLLASIYQGDSQLLQALLDDGTTASVRLADEAARAAAGLRPGDALLLGAAPRDCRVLAA